MKAFFAAALLSLTLNAVADVVVVAGRGTTIESTYHATTKCVYPVTSFTVATEEVKSLRTFVAKTANSVWDQVPFSYKTVEGQTTVYVQVPALVQHNNRTCPNALVQLLK